MGLLSRISRLLVGSLFIVSGLIKANDPLGFSYKLTDYFAPDVLDLTFLDPYALYLAVFICVVEIVLGVAAILGSKSKLTVWSLLLMIIFFTFLTFYSAYFNKVTDCGCFGDALKLTPWQSFTKDVVLLFFILIMFFDQANIKAGNLKEDVVNFAVSLVLIALFSLLVISWPLPIAFSLILFAIVFAIKHYVSLPSMDWVLAAIATVYSFGFSYYCIEHLPVKDFRPYAVGKSIPNQMVIPEGESGPEYAVEYTLVNAVSNEEKVMNSNDYISSGIWEDTTWTITNTSDPILVKEGYEPPIHDFVLTAEDGTDYTEAVLAEPQIALIFTYDLSKANADVQADLNATAKLFMAEGIKVVALTASMGDKLDDWKAAHNSPFEYYIADAIVLKTVIRSNPGVVLLNEGVVVDKWHYNDLPSAEQIRTLAK